MTERRRGSVLAMVGVGLLLPVAWLAAHLPLRAGLWVGRRIGDLLWLALPRRRAVALGNLARAFAGERSDAEMRRLGRQSFEHVGMNIIEGCVYFFRPPSVLLSRVDFAGAEHAEAAVVAAEGRGILVLAAHYGNWELLAASHALSVFPLSVVVRPLDHPLMDRLVDRFRRRSGVELIGKRRALGEILDALRRGRMVGILLDQNASRTEGVFAPFFGAPASTSKGLALIALRTGAPVLPIFIRRMQGGRHLVQADPVVEAPADGDPVAYTAAFNRSIETAIRRAPEQWFWMHNRWKTRPESEAG
jgi:Kdo2-lipid IVA lauroyltransferase/acyltransferase